MNIFQMTNSEYYKIGHAWVKDLFKKPRERSMVMQQYKKFVDVVSRYLLNFSVISKKNIIYLKSLIKYSSLFKLSI